MQRLQAFKFELMPNGEQQRNMRRFAGSCRFVYNKALALQKTRFDSGEKKLSYAGLCKVITEWRSETGWLAETHSQVLQQAMKHLERAYQNFFEKRADFPRFKRKGQGDSFRYPQGVKLDQGNARIWLPKLGWMRYRKSREVMGTVKNATVSFRCGKWFVSVQTEREVEPAVPTSTSAIGIDVGIARFATLSDGSHIEALNSFKRHEQRLARYQRVMSRKVKGSKNWHKAKRRVQRVHARIANCRSDFLHKTTTAITQDYALIVIEDLKVKGMSASAKGTRENPGRKVKQKTGLNRAILDQGWGEFRRQLEYKATWKGAQLIAVPAHYTSQTCPSCGHVSADNRKTQARFACVECGFEGNADTVDAINILARGHRVLACGEPVRSGHSTKQEPTEATQGIFP